MSNSIWHTADEKPEDGATIAFYLKDSMGSGDYDYDENEILVNCGFIKFSRITKWTYLKYLIAQADKAERLQEAVNLISNMEQRLCIDDPVDILDDVLKIAKDEIKQLIKEK